MGNLLNGEQPIVEKENFRDILKLEGIKAKGLGILGQFGVRGILTVTYYGSNSFELTPKIS